jgi:pimeloyl-ACP methyl ester carboxylesterase
MPRVEANGLSVFYSEAGSGFPLVFAHGGAADHSQWDPQVEELSKRYRVIIWDRRNCGQTEPKDTEESAETWVEDLRCFLDALGVAQAYVGGVSYGGLLSLEFALRHPQLVKAAIIVSATGEGFTPTANLTVEFPNRMAILSQIKTPSLVVQGQQDAIFPPAMGGCPGERAGQRRARRAGWRPRDQPGRAPGVQPGGPGVPGQGGNVAWRGAWDSAGFRFRRPGRLLRSGLY